MTRKEIEDMKMFKSINPATGNLVAEYPAGHSATSFSGTTEMAQYSHQGARKDDAEGQ
jgi:hypothetical protein